MTWPSARQASQAARASSASGGMVSSPGMPAAHTASPARRRMRPATSASPPLLPGPTSRITGACAGRFFHMAIATRATAAPAHAISSPGSVSSSQRPSRRRMVARSSTQAGVCERAGRTAAVIERVFMVPKLLVLMLTVCHPADVSISCHDPLQDPCPCSPRRRPRQPPVSHAPGAHPAGSRLSSTAFGRCPSGLSANPTPPRQGLRP